MDREETEEKNQTLDKTNLKSNKKMFSQKTLAHLNHLIELILLVKWRKENFVTGVWRKRFRTETEL